MKRFDPILVNQLKQQLEKFDNEVFPLPGIADGDNMECFIKQVIDSIRRVKYVTTIKEKPLTGHCTNALSVGFNPIMAASWHLRNGDIDEAMWLVFLLTYFGKSKSSGWRLMRGFYSGLGSSPAYWTWKHAYHNKEDLEAWLLERAEEVKSLGVFSNHRRYTSFKANSKKGPLFVFSNYFKWVGNNGSHIAKFDSLETLSKEADNPLFKVFYDSIPSGLSMNRLGKFDFLTMISKLGIVNMIADSTYMKGATGPLPGAKLLFWGSGKIDVNIKEIQMRMDTLASYLGYQHAMQILEDSVCNWQKDPSNYKWFTG
ncbi:hypothetical protein [Marinoscillum sp. 108]|uniref:alpha-glutamyl/putrescinyl thymine pyrophosphorylase clade 3 protein n=1 Tax=Marinoscillum sp. 108 TaxID=2653151 RepID=UPI0012EEF921|nr:hypothetical protein [Marinoscillum sp. 108]VXD18947.1 conserved hypothetical protein [Marinoscillum sp. 108]